MAVSMVDSADEAGEVSVQEPMLKWRALAPSSGGRRLAAFLAVPGAVALLLAAAATWTSRPAPLRAATREAQELVEQAAAPQDTPRTADTVMKRGGYKYKCFNNLDGLPGIGEDWHTDADLEVRPSEVHVHVNDKPANRRRRAGSIDRKHDITFQIGPKDKGGHYPIIGKMFVDAEDDGHISGELHVGSKKKKVSLDGTWFATQNGFDRPPIHISAKGAGNEINWTWYPMDDWCSRYDNCWQTRCCKNKGDKCYMKDDKHAGCRKECAAGETYEHDPEEYRTPWNCTELKSSDLTLEDMASGQLYWDA